jgi:ATP-dependent protease HslVU (ClpYQ) peptidase subunit
MTCIVGVELDNKVLIGGDIQGTGGNNKIVHTQPKVFHKRNIIFGYTTSYRFGQILENHLTDPVVPEESEEIYRWLVTVLVPSMKEILEAHDYKDGGQCLIGIRNQLWDLQSDYSVLRSVQGFSACGSGSEYAMGSMSTSLEWMTHQNGQDEIDLRDAISLAIKTAGTFSPSVGTKSIIIST